MQTQDHQKQEKSSEAPRPGKRRIPKRKHDPEFTALFMDTATSIGLTRKEAISALHAQGYNLTKTDKH